MSDARNTTLEIRELLRDPTLQGVGTRKLYLLLRERGHEYTQKQVQIALGSVREHVVRQHQPSRAWGFVPPARGWCEADLGEFRHQREKRYLLAVIDVGSKQLYGVLLHAKDAAKMSDAIEVVLNAAEPPVRVFRSDIGSEFVNRTVGRLLRSRGVRQAPTRGTCHFVERVIGSVRRNVSERLAIDPSQSLDDALDAAVTQYNNTVHTAHRMTPLEAGTDANWPVAHARLLARARLPDEVPDNRQFSAGERVYSLKEGALHNKERAQFWSRSAKEIRAIDDDRLTDTGFALSDGANAYRASDLRRADGVSSLRLPAPPPARARAPAVASSAAASSSSAAAPPRSSARRAGRARPDYATTQSAILYQ